ncbi:MAG: hypothetical protein M1834_003514 [Cirrosporium novae-zelandiae]|nr:MAG: hypothetical protein M1834_003514 [Cirrosporium novae-zelandiae]
MPERPEVENEDQDNISISDILSTLSSNVLVDKRDGYVATIGKALEVKSNHNWGLSLSETDKRSERDATSSPVRVDDTKATHPSKLGKLQSTSKRRIGKKTYRSKQRMGESPTMHLDETDASHTQNADIPRPSTRVIESGGPMMWNERAVAEGETRERDSITTVQIPQLTDEAQHKLLTWVKLNRTLDIAERWPCDIMSTDDSVQNLFEKIANRCQVDAAGIAWTRVTFCCHPPEPMERRWWIFRDNEKQLEEFRKEAKMVLAWLYKERGAGWLMNALHAFQDDENEELEKRKEGVALMQDDCLQFELSYQMEGYGYFRILGS